MKVAVVLRRYIRKSGSLFANRMVKIEQEEMKMKIKKILACFLCIVTMMATVQIPTRAYDGQPLGKNVAYNRTVKVSNSFATNDYNKPEFLTDGNLSRGYQAACVYASDTNRYYDPQTWSMDLGKVYTIDTVVLYWENAAASKYKIYVSETNAQNSWELVATETKGTQGKFKYNFQAAEARYVKIELEERALEQYGYCLYELQIFTVGSVEERVTTNLAKSATATASADDGEHPAINAIDGNDNTMWRTTYYQDPAITDAEKADENLTLQWASPQTFDTVKIKWNGGYMKGYKLQVSKDGVEWNDVYEVTNGKANEYRTIKLEEAITTSYLRLQGVTFGEYCFEIYELEVYDETNIPVEKINLNYNNVKLNLDNEEAKRVTLEYNLDPSNTSEDEILWSSSNENVAKVVNGVVTGVSSGRAVVTIASKTNPNVKTQCNVSVSEELDKAKVSATRTNKDIKVTWNKINHAASYILTRTNKNTGIVSNVYKGTDTSYEDKALLSGNYVYTVTAVVNENETDADLYSNSTSDESDVILIPEDVTGIEVLSDYQHVSMFIGDSEQIKYTVLPSNATNNNVQFKSLNESIATVDENGIVTGVSEGNTTVILTTEEGGFTAECTVHVDEISVKNLDRISAKSIVMDVNKTSQLEINIEPENATDKTIRWSSSNPAIASVDDKGLVTAKANGYVVVTATASNGKSVDFYIEVKSAVSSIRLNIAYANVYLGKSITLSATVLPANATNKTIQWLSSNDTIASVDQAGHVVGKMIGTTYISAMSADGKVIATCAVNVIKVPVTHPVKVKIKSAKKTGKKVVVKWKKVADAAGYEIYMKTGSGKYKKVKTITKAKTVKYTKSLKSGKTYKFKIRAYKLDDGEKVYGTYSKIKKVKIKAVKVKKK